MVQCEEGELAFFNVTFLNLQSEEDCLDDNDNFRCSTMAVGCVLVYDMYCV